MDAASLALIVLVTVWGMAAAALWLRDAEDADIRYTRTLLAGALFALWTYAALEIVDSPLRRVRPLFHSLGSFRLFCALSGAAAAAGLWAAGRFAPSFVGGLKEALPKGKWFLILPALLTLAPHGYRMATFPRRAWSVERLAAAARGADAAAARKALDLLGDKGEEGLQPLEEALEDPLLGEQAMQSLSRIGVPAIPVLIRALEGDFGWKAAAAEHLGRIGPQAREALPALERATRSLDPQTAARAKDAVARIATPAALNALREQALKEKAQRE